MPIDFHKRNKGKIEIKSKVSIDNNDDLSLAYTPGVAKVSQEIFKDKSKVYELTSKSNMIAIVTDGSAVLGLGDIGPEAALPVMEGKSALFKQFGGVDAIPIVLDTKDSDEIINIVKKISPGFGGINLEDISAPRCFEIEKRLKQELDILVFHDDQHGSAIAVLAALINALKIVGKKFSSIKVVINGAGAAGIATANILIEQGVTNLFLVDSKGVTCTPRIDLNEYKMAVANKVNMDFCGDLSDAVKDADVFIGVSIGNLLSKEMVKSMAKDAIVIAMANPLPEIMPNDAYEAGAAIVATGRSDFSNQVNNSLVFPGLFRGALDVGAKKITREMILAAAHALAAHVKNPSKDKIIPGMFDKGVADTVADAVKDAVIE
ncbi:NADP-dependent malic enzyme [Candidatus Woesearchaeota archaeon]|nr:NADP-dependent malic enzyme [Candidatus Woesearchaeota archaeon]